MTTINPNLHPLFAFPHPESDFSEPSESEYEEFTVKKPTKTKKKDKVSTKDRIKPDPTSEKDKQPLKPSKTKPEAAGWFQQLTLSILLTFVTKTLKNILAASKPVKSLPTSKPTPTRPPSTKPSSFLSPAVGRVPKWNPPGPASVRINTFTFSSGLPFPARIICLLNIFSQRAWIVRYSPLVKSPSQGLRLGLSRLVRVKPLHPSIASH
ncbi:RAD51-associated protein 1-like [Oryzias latipes]|uniref:RAD51-associated protein 1-like n=1 Tax=Oryzias latipes TaxID=8090 RepID=UPI000CE1ECFC|nr:RAD51-associated protein 1-like [Oryzias latipes]